MRIGAFDEAALYQVPDDASVVFVINHRSNMDYVLVTYLVSENSALSYAVGEWAQVWGLRSLIRAMGGYFVRRDSSNPLYRKVLARYVHMATASGVAQAVFPEGGLTRDGSLRPPKLGILSYAVSGFDPQGPRDIVFVPVGLNYDRVLEDRVQVAAAATPQGERPRFAFNPAGADGLSRCAACGCGCAAAGIASAMPASASAGPCRCGTTFAIAALDFRALASRPALCRDRAARPAADAGGGPRRAGAARFPWWRRPFLPAASAGCRAWS